MYIYDTITLQNHNDVYNLLEDNTHRVLGITHKIVYSILVIASWLNHSIPPFLVNIFDLGVNEFGLNGWVQTRLEKTHIRVTTYLHHLGHSQSFPLACSLLFLPLLTMQVLQAPQMKRHLTWSSQLNILCGCDPHASNESFHSTTGQERKLVSSVLRGYLVYS